MLSDDELAAIRARWQASTLGEWQVEGCAVVHQWGLFQWEQSGTADESANAAFIAHAHQDVPALLDAIAELRALVAALAPGGESG